MAFRRLGDYILRYLGLGGATGDASNPLSVRGPGALFDGDTGGHQIRVNKAAVGDTASYLFQTGFSGRAEFGLIGNDNFGLKVSTDGSAFTDVFTVSGTGTATFAQDTLFSGGVGIGGASPDSTNRLSVNTEAALFNNAGSDIRFTMNKAAVGDDAALTFQDGFSTRALIGLLANDDFTFKVSPDGSTFYDAFVIDKDDGSVSFPSTNRLEPVYFTTTTPDTSALNNVNGSGETLEVLSHGFGRSRLAGVVTGTDTGGADGVRGERDALMSCTSGVTYAQAVAAVEAIGARLPTVNEIYAGAGLGTGCGFDALQVWTQTPGVAAGTRMTTLGSSTSGAIEVAETTTAAVTYVFDKQHPGANSVTTEGFADNPTGNYIAAQLPGTAKAFSDGLNAKLTALGGVGGGNPAKTTQIVMATNTGFIQMGSADDGNTVEVYANGVDFAAGTVATRLFMSKGEVRTVTNAEVGAVITSSKGVNGASELSGGRSGPMPFGLEGYAGTQFFMYAFRQSAGTSVAETGKVYVAAGAVASSVELRNGDGTVVVDSAELQPFGLVVLLTNANSEFQIVATQPVFVAAASNASDGTPQFDDLRLVPPLSTELIGHGRSGFVSALYANTTVDYYVQDGATGSLTVSPGSPVGIGAIAGDSGYAKAGFMVLRASGPISAFSGADGDGFEATPFYPLSALAQRIPVPMSSANTGQSYQNSIAIASPYKGTATIYNTDGSVYVTVPFDRATTVATTDDQLVPCAALVAPSTAAAEDVVMPYNYTGGYIEADVPIYVVQNTSQNATLLSGITSNADEIVWPGITPDDIRAELRRDANGFLRKRVISAAGAETWELT